VRPDARLAPDPRANTSELGPLGLQQADAPAAKLTAGTHAGEWAASAHASARVNCSDCHGAADVWVARPKHAACQRCHESEAKGFLSGMHGMRLADGLTPELSPMTPAQARLPMQPLAAHRELGCQSCHGAHAYDRQHAATDACLDCHADDHSKAYRSSPHADLLAADLAGRAPPGTGVSCATCHLPRQSDGTVQHNQNDNLRPNEKMVRGVCLHCHGLEFTLDALADAELVKANFRGRPVQHVRSLDMIRAQLAGRNRGAADKP
jgi:hypothetical protein